jgi:hypothetical protein
MLTNVFKIMSLLDYNNTILKENNLSKYLFNITNLQFLTYFKTNSLSIKSCSINSNDIIMIDNEPISILEKNSDASLSEDNSLISSSSKDSYLSKNSCNPLDSKISFLSDSKELSLSESDKLRSFNYESLSSCESNSSCGSLSLYKSFSSCKFFSPRNSISSSKSQNKAISYESFSNKEINMDYIEFNSEISDNINLQFQKIQHQNSDNYIYYIIKHDYDMFYTYLTKLDLIKSQNISLYNNLYNRGLYLNLHIIQNGFFELLELYENK